MTDLGATLGRVGGLGGKRSKNNLADFQRFPMVKNVRGGTVEFDYRTRSSGLGYFTFILSSGYWKGQTNKEKAMRRIDVENARWMAGQLLRLTDEQLRSAFRAAGYKPLTVDGYIRAIRDRINQIERPPLRDTRAEK